MWIIGILVSAILAVAIVGIVWGRPLFREAQILAAPWRWNMVIKPRIEVPTRDGQKLLSELMLPRGKGPWPTILIRTPYGENTWDEGKYFTQHGYVVMSQNVRGRYGSTGTFTASKFDGPDSYDTLDWIVKQPWSNKRVGTFGCSYRGETQIYLARLHHPAHMAAIPMGAGGAIGTAKNSYAYFGAYENGVLLLSSELGWFTIYGDKHDSDDTLVTEDRIAKFIRGLPVSELGARITPRATDYKDFVTHPLGDPWWDRFGYVTDKDTFAVPALHVNSWYDQTVRDAFDLADVMRSNQPPGVDAPQDLLIGPGNHCKYEETKDRVGEMPVANAQVDWWGYYLEWFDRWLKDKPATFPRYRVFVLGANEWRDFNQWPPANAAPQKLFLSRGTDAGAEGALVANVDRIENGVDHYAYNPADPVPSLGGAVCCTGSAHEADSGAFDQRKLETRPDVLVYTSDVLEQPLRVVGDNEAVLYVESDAPDTDFTVKLIDVWPDGRAFNIQDSVVRARFRDGYEHPEMMEPGKVYRLVVHLGPIAAEFGTGHRIRIDVSSSNFPRLARNLNTGGELYTGSKMRIANNAVYHDRDDASYLQLSVTH